MYETPSVVLSIMFLSPVLSFKLNKAFKNVVFPIYSLPNMEMTMHSLDGSP
jgi:hypothetical protein